MEGVLYVIDAIEAEIIAKKYYKDVYSYCFSYFDCDAEEASDITQDVFLFFQEKCETLEDTNIRAWLYKVAKNKVREHFRKLKKEEKLLALEKSMANVTEEDIIPLFDEHFNMKDEEILKYKDIVLKGLTKKEQLLYTKIFIEKKKYKEIAEELNITEKAVNSRALRLRVKIRNIVRLMFTSVGQFVIKMFF